VSNLQTQSGMEPSTLQGTLNGSAAVGDKRPNTDSAGSFMSRRRTSTCVTSQRRVISQVKGKRRSNKQEPFEMVPNCIVLEHTDQVVNVSTYSEELDTMETIPIVIAATVIDDPRTGTTTILILGQALYMGDKVKNTLLCPNQMRANGIVVNNVPLHLAPRDKPSTHSIFSPEDEFTIPLVMKGIFSCFPAHTLTWEEIESCKHVKLTDEFNWDPHSGDFQEQEVNLVEHLKGDYNIPSEYRRIMQVTHEQHYSTQEAPFFNEWSLRHLVSTNTSKRAYKTTPEKLAASWNIGLETAKKTLQVTTQKGMRQTTFPIEQRFRTRQAQLR
jgi:hypothetical protein